MRYVCKIVKVVVNYQNVKLFAELIIWKVQSFKRGEERRSGRRKNSKNKHGGGSKRGKTGWRRENLTIKGGGRKLIDFT